MIRRLVELNSDERDLARTIIVFLKNRMTERSAINWGAGLDSKRFVERSAVISLLESPENISEPWLTAWRLLVESWRSEEPQNSDTIGVHEVRHRLVAGERSSSLVTEIVRAVRPRLKVAPIGSPRLTPRKNHKNPREYGDILYASLTSGKLMDLRLVKLSDVKEVRFLTMLAASLEVAVNEGIDIGGRIGWNDQKSTLELGLLYRVYYDNSIDHSGRRHDPDAFHRGIAPAVKLLHAVVRYVADLDPSAARILISGWRASQLSIFRRLWAALARDAVLVRAVDVETFLMGTENREFWDLTRYPEIAELRARRFFELSELGQRGIVGRIQKLPPRSMWHNRVDKGKVNSGRQFAAARELRRIELGGGVLPAGARAWLESYSGSDALTDLAMESGFPTGAIAAWRSSTADDRFDVLVGDERLAALEAALTTSDNDRLDAYSDKASNWIQDLRRTEGLLADLEASEDGGENYPNVWNRFGWAHEPIRTDDEDAITKNIAIAARVTSVLARLSENAIRVAIEGVSAWLARWASYVVASPAWVPVWIKIWPIAVEATDRRTVRSELDDFEASASLLAGSKRQQKLDTLNNPAGMLVGVFLSACPNLFEDPEPFTAGRDITKIRDMIMSATGQSGLVARSRLVEHISYFLGADKGWALEQLISALLRDDDNSVHLWTAISHQVRRTDVLEFIGDEMADRTSDMRLERNVRDSLVFSILVESMDAFRVGRAPAISSARVQQMIRTLDDEVRATAAGVIPRYLEEISAHDGREDPNAVGPINLHQIAGDIFYQAVKPFIEKVWPKESSLVTPATSAAFAEVPANSRAAFADAAATVSHLIIPFECWSLLDFGFFDDNDSRPSINIIIDEEGARALLGLLNKAVGTAEGSVVPHDLTVALDRIASVSPKVAESQPYRRLATAARR